jgi:hypothetical protein
MDPGKKQELKWAEPTAATTMSCHSCNSTATAISARSTPWVSELSSNNCLAFFQIFHHEKRSVFSQFFIKILAVFDRGGFETPLNHAR